MEDQISFNPELSEGVTETCVGDLSCAIQRFLEVANPMSHSRADPRPPMPDHIQDEIRLKDQLRTQWQITRDPGLKAEVNEVGDPTAVRVERR